MKNIINVILITIILYILFIKKDKKSNIVIQDYLVASSNIKSNKKENILVNPSYVKEHDNMPSFRGLYRNVHILEKDELGGSKVFSHIKIDNDNEKINLVKYNNYTSYRRKPIKKNNIKNPGLLVGKSTCIN